MMKDILKKVEDLENLLEKSISSTNKREVALQSIPQTERDLEQFFREVFDRDLNEELHY